MFDLHIQKILGKWNEFAFLETKKMSGSSGQVINVRCPSVSMPNKRIRFNQPTPSL
jgi:hypothetical protein